MLMHHLGGPTVLSHMPSDVASALLQGKQCNTPLSQTSYLAQQMVECDMEGSETPNSPDWKREQRKDANLQEVLNHLQDKINGRMLISRKC